jgi:CubicO group peptidase (beta-lactamase class C family)
MKIILLTLTLVFGLLTFANGQTTENNLRDSIDFFVKNRFRDYSGVILIAANEEVIFQKSGGFKDNKKRLPNDSQTAFKIGSMTKPFTAAAIMLLEQEGKLKTSDKISRYITKLPKEWEEITINELLTHTSGLMHSWELKGFAEYFKKTEDRQCSDVINLYYDKPMRPDKKYYYSGLGYFVLARIIEIASGDTYNKYMEKAIFNRLNMNSTYGYQSGDKNPNLSIGYYANSSPTDLTNIGFLFGGGNLVSTVEDIFKFDRSLYHNTLLNQASIEKIFTPLVKIEDSGSNFYGLGWFIENGDPKRITHGGRVPGFINYYVRIPELKLFFVFLSNQEVNQLDVADELTLYVTKLFKQKVDNRPIR